MHRTLLLVALGAIACKKSPPDVAAEGPASVSPDLVVTPLRPGVWLHTSWRDVPGAGRIGANGLLVRDSEGGLLLLDTPWGLAPTEQLLAWVQSDLGQAVEAAVVTHAHDDSLGGVAALHSRGIPVVGHPRAVLLATDGPVRALRTLEASDAVYLGAAELFYPGPGHSSDNVVAWLPDSSVLFGGCLVKPEAAVDLGNTADADPTSWSIALARVANRYPDAVLVVPGHGEPGGFALLAHTEALLASPDRPAAPPVTDTHRALCQVLAGPAGVARVPTVGTDRLAPAGATALDAWVLTGTDLGLRVAQGFPLRTDLAFRHDSGWLVCGDPYAAISPSVLQERRHCEPVAGESDVWWWCPDEG